MTRQARHLLACLGAAGVAASLLIGPTHAAPRAATPAPFVTLSISQGKFRLAGHHLTPDSYAGALLVYRNLAHTTQRTARVNIDAGRIQTDGSSSYVYEVTDDGDVTFAGSTNLISGGTTPGDLVAVISTTAGETLDVEAAIP